MTTDPRIRAATPDDAAGITRIHVGSWQTAYRGILPDERLDALDVAERTEIRRGHLEKPFSPELRNWVLVEEGSIVGWAATGPNRDEDLDDTTHELYAIYLDPECVGTGLGRALMDHCLEDVGGRGHFEMTMWVLEGNDRAQRFYAAAGFRPDERVPREEFDGTGALKLRMRRSLP